MASAQKVSAPSDYEMNAVEYMQVSDSEAHVWMRKDIQTVETTETVDGTEVTNSSIEAEELFFIIDPSTATKQDIEDNFDKYWIYGEQWEDESRYDDSEKISRLEEENESLRHCIDELMELIEQMG